MKTVLLTGGSGFIGRNAVPFLLEKGYDVHLVHPPQESPAGLDSRVHCHAANLFNAENQRTLFQTIKPSHLLHFAWYAVHGKYWTSNENLRWVQASLEMLRNFADNGGRRIVLAGTCAEYDWSQGNCRENTTPANPKTLYGVCKNSLHQMVWHWGRLNNISYAWGRIFFLYGPREHPARLVPSIINALLENRKASLTMGNQIRDFLYVEDVASAFVSLLDCSVEGPVNIASGIPIALKEIAILIGNKLGRAHLLNFGAIPMNPDDPPLLIANTDRLRDEVSWKPRFDLDVGIDQSIEWWSKIQKK